MHTTKGQYFKILALDLLESLSFYITDDSSILRTINHLFIYSYKYFTLKLFPGYIHLYIEYLNIK